VFSQGQSAAHGKAQRCNGGKDGCRGGEGDNCCQAANVAGAVLDLAKFFDKHTLQMDYRPVRPASSLMARACNCFALLPRIVKA